MQRSLFIFAIFSESLIFLLYVFVHVSLVPCLYQPCADGVSINNE